MTGLAVGKGIVVLSDNLFLTSSDKSKHNMKIDTAYYDRCIRTLESA